MYALTTLSAPVRIRESRQHQELTLASLFGRQPEEKLLPEQEVCWEDEVGSDSFVLVKGYLRVHRTDRGGNRAILRFGYPGDVFGLALCDPHNVTATAITPVKLKRIPRARLDAYLDESTSLRRDCRSIVCKEMLDAERHVIMLGCTKADKRLATFLLELATRLGCDHRSQMSIEVPFTRSDIANYLGLTVETVSREFTKFKRAGLISMQGPHRAHLQKIPTLRAIAGVVPDELDEI